MRGSGRNAETKKEKERERKREKERERERKRKITQRRGGCRRFAERKKARGEVVQSKGVAGGITSD
jgi:hypothetical protein